MNEITKEEKNIFISNLEKRFFKNIIRHPNINWNEIQSCLQKNENIVNSIYYMEISGGEPDVVNIGDNEKNICFVDCSKESPKGRRSLCYDREALLSRKDYPPKNSVIDICKEYELQLLNENQYKNLQKIICVDTSTSSWIHTPKSIRDLGGAIFADYRYGQVFIYHNTAPSYYASRGFRAYVKLS